MTALASAIWSFLSALARRLAQAGWLKSERLGVRVISVGNLQVGGAGKTPLVAAIAREAEQRGLRVCILSRGYGGDWESRGGIVPPGEESADARLCGDEPALLHELAPRATIAVGARRVAQYRKAEALQGVPFDLVILDDGFQHWRIRRGFQGDLDILALTSARWTNTLFRDWPSAAARAGLLVWTKGETRPRDYGRPMVRVRFKLPDPEGDTRALWLVTGLADGRAARASIEAAGYRVDNHLIFPDHAQYEMTMVYQILDQARAAHARVALTGKDWVKWRSLGVEPSQVRVLEPELEFVEGRDHWDRAIWGAS